MLFFPASSAGGTGAGTERGAVRGCGWRSVGTERKDEVASFSLLPLILDFLIKITRTMSAQNASTCFYFSWSMETTCRIYPFLFPSKMQMEELVQGRPWYPVLNLGWAAPGWDVNGAPAGTPWAALTGRLASRSAG